MNRLTTNHRTVLTGQENDDARHFRGLSRPPHGRCKVILLLFPHGGGDKGCPYRTWSDGVDADLLVDELVGETSRKGDDGAFGGGVVEEIGTTDVGVDGSVVDDGAAAGVLEEVGKGGFGEVEECCSPSVHPSMMLF